MLAIFSFVRIYATLSSCVFFNLHVRYWPECLVCLFLCNMDLAYDHNFCRLYCIYPWNIAKATDQRGFVCILEFMFIWSTFLILFPPKFGCVFFCVIFHNTKKFSCLSCLFIFVFVCVHYWMLPMCMAIIFGVYLPTACVYLSLNTDYLPLKNVFRCVIGCVFVVYGN